MMNAGKLKVDLHVHLGEAVNFVKPSFNIAKKVVDAIKERGLDGIAITDHDRNDYAFQMKEVIETHFHDIVIICGQEVRFGLNHVVELFLSDDVTFRFIAHPGRLSNLPKMIKNGIHGLEIENGSFFINKENISALAETSGLILLSNSDAHSLSDIGRHYNNIDLEELKRRAKS